MVGKRAPSIRTRFAAVSLLWVCGPWGVLSAWGGELGSEPPGSNEAQLQIAALIEQLGDPAYPRRERAQEQLRAFGLVAFDALLEASHHDDVEIAHRARYLVRSMPDTWSIDSDPETVQRILRGYGRTGAVERQNRMQHLAALPASQGIPALCRVMRYESDALLSKQAALYVMSHSAPAETPDRSELSEAIRGTVGSSRRPAARWLRTYAQTLLEPDASLAEWDEITRAEELEYARFPQRTAREIVRDLLRWQADLLQQLGRSEAFLGVVRRMLESVQGEYSELFDLVDWALEREAWIVVDEVADRYPHEFFKSAILVYRLAEAQLRREEHDLARQTARRALDIDPDRPEQHHLLGDYLTTRLLYDWAEQEYRYVITHTTPTPTDGLHLEARFFLANLLFDLQKYGEAAKVVRGAVEAIEENPKVLRAAPRREAHEVRGALHYYLAMDCGERNDTEQQLDHLRQAVELDPSNPDFLIALYRVPHNGPDVRREVLQLIDTVRQRLEARIRLYESAFSNPNSAAEQLEATEELSQACNELAWLISNTEGDFEAALQYSLRSLQLRPDSEAYLDTAGRCFYARGDYVNAVKYQSRAVERAPFIQQIRRQLKLFQDALAASEGSP